MLYSDGLSVELGHLVAVPVPEGTEMGRVVMLGDTAGGQHVQAGKRTHQAAGQGGFRPSLRLG
jgi:hypothetical protein